METFENGDVSYSCGRAKTEVFKHALQGWRLLKTGMHRIRADGRKRRFSNAMTSCLGSRLALPHIRFEDAMCRRKFFKYEEKTSNFENTRLRVDGQIRFKKRYVWTQIFFFNTEEKISVFENTRLRVDEALNSLEAKTQKLGFCLMIGSGKV